MLRDWLQLFRAQTTPATVFSIVVPYLLAGGRDPLVFWVLFWLGTLLHWFTFGHNSVMDYWYDIHDPHKKHHPLEAGRIDYSTANTVINYGLAFITAGLVMATLAWAKAPVLALANLALYLAFGHAYNDGLDKNTPTSFLPITLCFSHLALYGWFMATDQVNVVTLLLYLWAAMTIFFQIAWEGNLKDIWNPSERNMLRLLGVKAVPVGDGRYVINDPAGLRYAFAFMRIFGNTVVLYAMASILAPGSPIFVLAFALLTIVEAYAVAVCTFGIVMTTRDRLLEAFGLAEAVEFFRLITVFMATGGTNALVGFGLILYGLLWFTAMNKLLWRSRFGPKV